MKPNEMPKVNYTVAFWYLWILWVFSYFHRSLVMKLFVALTKDIYLPQNLHIVSTVFDVSHVLISTILQVVFRIFTVLLLWNCLSLWQKTYICPKICTLFRLFSTCHTYWLAPYYRWLKYDSIVGVRHLSCVLLCCPNEIFFTWQFRVAFPVESQPRQSRATEP